MTAAPVILDRDDHSGLVESSAAGRVRVRLPAGVVLDLPDTLVTRLDDGSYRADVSFAEFGSDSKTVFQEIEEHVHVGTRVEERGRVVARTVTETRDEAVEADGWRETVDVERVSVGRVVDSVEGVRDEDGVTVVPVYEEVLVVHKQLVLREELRLTTRRERVPGPERVTLRRQRVEVDRLPPSDAGD